MRILERHEIQPYEVALVHWENEEINYTVREYVNAHRVMFVCFFFFFFSTKYSTVLCQSGKFSPSGVTLNLNGGTLS